MKLEWVTPGYALSLTDVRESQLVLDLMIEAGYALHRLPDDEHRLRLGVDKDELRRVIDRWQTGNLLNHLDVRQVELIRASWFEALHFYSDREFHLRTGWQKEECRLLFDVFIEDRRKLTLERQWGWCR